MLRRALPRLPRLHEDWRSDHRARRHAGLRGAETVHTSQSLVRLSSRVVSAEVLSPQTPYACDGTAAGPAEPTERLELSTFRLQASLRGFSGNSILRPYWLVAGLECGVFAGRAPHYALAIGSC